MGLTSYAGRTSGKARIIATICDIPERSSSNGIALMLCTILKEDTLN